MKSFVLAAALLVLAPAAARAQSTTADLPPMIEFSSMGELDVRAAPVIRIAEGRFAASPERVWEVLPEVLRELGIEPQVDTTRERVMGNTRITAPRVGGERTSRYMTCGNDGGGPASAGQYRIRLNLVTQVRAEGTGTRTFTRLVGTATSVQGGSGSVMGCVTTGRLEQKIAAGITARLANAAAPARQ
ncbi:MAG TPA: hypothetical protein VF665_05310 [Longimicrobium sp.]|jgi:hypothetical protein|uniref:hypothetical protein n=1 Tax=Longimicrobium sp. TaxID=2029185 RepID=UPI002ED8FB98